MTKTFTQTVNYVAFLFTAKLLNPKKVAVFQSEDEISFPFSLELRDDLMGLGIEHRQVVSEKAWICVSVEEARKFVKLARAL